MEFVSYDSKISSNAAPSASSGFCHQLIVTDVHQKHHWFKSRALRGTKMLLKKLFLAKFVRKS